VTARLATPLTALLRAAARLLPPDRRDWAEAVRAEAAEVPAGAPRLRWLAGGLVLVTREAAMGRKIFYWLGVAGLAAAAAWAVWLSWRTVPSADAESATDRVRVLIGIFALIALPWVGRARGLFGSVGGSITARVVRLAGLATICRLGLVLVQSDSHAGTNGVGYGSFVVAREAIGLALLGVAIALTASGVRERTRATARAAGAPADPAAAARPAARQSGRRDPMTLLVFAVMAVSAAFLLIPVQMLTLTVIAAVLAATARGSRVAPGTMVAGIVFALPATAGYWGLTQLVGEVPGLVFIVLGIALLTGIAAGATAVTFSSGTETPRAALIQQGLLAGLVAGVAAGLLLSQLTLLGVVILVLAPAVGLVGGMGGGAIAADHPRAPRPGGSRYAGLFVSRS
jgi:hypothetical protein